MEDETHLRRDKKSLSVWRINKVAVQRIFHQAWVDFIYQNYCNIFLKLNVPKVTGKKIRLSNKLCFNLLKFYNSEPTIRHFVQLTSCSSDHLEKLTRVQLAKKNHLLLFRKREFRYCLPPREPCWRWRSILTSTTHTGKRSSESFLLPGFMTKALYFSLLSYVSYLPPPSHSHFLHRPNFILWTLQFMKLFIMRTTSVSH
jgi:hypothetical protein